MIRFKGSIVPPQKNLKRSIRTPDNSCFYLHTAPLYSILYINFFREFFYVCRFQHRHIHRRLSDFPYPADDSEYSASQSGRIAEYMEHKRSFLSSFPAGGIFLFLHCFAKTFPETANRHALLFVVLRFVDCRFSFSIRTNFRCKPCLRCFARAAEKHLFR